MDKRSCDYVVGQDNKGKPIYCSGDNYKTIVRYLPNGRKYGIKKGTRLCKEHYDFIADCCDTRGINFSRKKVSNVLRNKKPKLPKLNKPSNKIMYYFDDNNYTYLLLMTSGNLPRKDEIVTIRNIDYIVKEINYQLESLGKPDIIRVSLEEIREINCD